MVKIKTEKESLFGQRIKVRNEFINVDKQGYAEVEESLVANCLLLGYTLVDKNAKFQSKEEQSHAAKASEIIEAANKQAEAIIEAAHLKADEILNGARKELAEKGVVVGEQKELLEKLNKHTNDQLREHLKAMEIAETEFKGMNKDQLIRLIFSLTYPENIS